jgi:hypothetical protein
MEITFKIKRFNELSVTELYDVLQLRSEVFVVEQKLRLSRHRWQRPEGTTCFRILSE